MGYLNIERTSNTLSGGEFQRVRLARQLGSDLTDMMYLLDEPSRGLHPKDKQKLYPIFKRLCDNGNTLVIIDHDPGLLSHVDFVVEMGPQGGEKGGEVLRTGSFEDLKVEKESFTALISSPPKKVKKDKKRETGKKNFIHIKNFSAFNIENLEIKIPLGEICAIAGVSGSGKSTLLEEGILPAVKNALQANREEDPRFSVDLCFQSYSFMKQDLARANARSDVCTFLEVLGPMREFFAGLPDARKMGLRPYNFSYNHLKGMCRECWGLGYKKENMLFMPELYLPCPVCAGMRLNKQSLSVFWGRYHLGNLLQESILSLLSLFSFHPKISKILQAVVDVGLPYLKIGQQIDTLSDGEVQRLKLARELSKKSRGKTLFLLDEPGVGLFHSEVELLKKALSDLKERGHSVIMIEHDPSLLNFADHVIEMGPGSGKEGGRVVYQGKY